MGVFLFYAIPKGRKLTYRNLNLILNEQSNLNLSKREIKTIALKSYKNTAKSFLIPFWLYEYLITNQSWYTATVLSAAALFIYYIINNIILNIIFLYNNPAMMSILPSIGIIAQELIVTSTLVGLGYAIYSIVKNRSPRYQIFLHT